MDIEDVARLLRLISDGEEPIAEADVAAAVPGTERDVLSGLYRMQACIRTDKSALFLESIVEHIPDMIFVKDAKDLRFVRFNAAGELLLGSARQDLIGKNDFDFFPTAEAEAFTAKDREVLSGGVVVDIPEEPIHTRGGVRWLHTKKIPILDQAGVPAFLLGISEDITDRKAAAAELARRSEELARTNHELRRTEEELRTHARQLRFLLAHFPGVLWTVDDQLRFTSVAGARVEELGLEGVDGRSITDLLRSEAPLTAQDAHRGALGGTPGNYEFRHQRRVYEVRVEPVAGQEEGGVIGIALDVTEHRRLEEARLGERLERAQRLEQLGMLAGGIAHDFNNLLASILGNASLALLKLAEEHPARRILDRVITSADHAADLTRQLLAYSGRGRFVVERVDLSRMVEDIAGLLRVSISKRAALKLLLDPELPGVEADIAQMRQLLLNLITNASDAIGDHDGALTVSTSTVDADRAWLSSTYLDDDLPAGRYVCLEVSDTGGGMDATTQARMFDPFFTTKPKGHGLGLAATLGIVRGHRGAIRVYSEPGRGTTIKVLFPVSEEQGVVEAAPRPAPGNTRLGVVMVVDDDEAIRIFATEALRDAGFYVVSAVDGADAVEQFRHLGPRIDAVLLDMTMPRMNGEEAFRELRRMRPEVPVMLSSGYNEQDATSRFAGKGLAGFLQKPYRATDLVDRMCRLMGKSAG